MGVTGLWKLIEQSGKEVLIDTLENKVLAIDISIWLHQVIKGYQDKRGNALQHAHLLGLFNRLCKLLYYRIKPVFIFDGLVPALKRDTIARRQQGRTKILKEVERIQELLLEAINKEKIVQQALDPNADKVLSSPDKCNKLMNEVENGIFIIPEYLSQSKIREDSTEACSSSDLNTSLSEGDSFDDSNLQHFYNLNLQSIDVTSSHFKSLPADVRLEILGDIRQMRKQHSWGKLHEMPTKSDNFSEFQMKRLLKRRQVQVSLEQAEKELEGRCLTLSELETFLSEQGIVTAEQKANSRINSDSNTRFLLVKDLKKAIEKAAKVELMKNESTDEEIINKEQNHSIIENKILGNSKEMNDEVSTNFDTLSEDGDESDINDEEFQLAIQLSLNQTDTYNDNDYISSRATLNKEQRNMFKNATGSARDYLLKYGLIKNLNLDEIDESQIEASLDTEILNGLKHNKTLMAEIIDKKSNQLSDESKKNEIKVEDEKKCKVIGAKGNEVISIISDDSDSDIDFIEVNEPLLDSNVTQNTEKIQIHLDPTKSIEPEEDLFADIFQTAKEISSTLSETSLIKSNIDNEKNIQNENSIDPLIVKCNKKEENISNILKELQKEASTIEKLSLEDIRIETQATFEFIKVKDSQDNLNTEQEIQHIEVPDSQEQKFEQKITTEKEVQINNTSLKSEIPIVEVKDSQETTNENECNDSENELHQIEVPDSQEQQRYEKKTVQGDFQDNSICHENKCPLVVEIPDSQERSAHILGNSKDNDQSIIEITDSQLPSIKPNESVKITTDIIEILDDSVPKTPSKQKIEDFFNTEYVIKKTPPRNNEDEEIVPKVASPFFVKKSPGSGSKKKLVNGQDLSTNKISKVSKALFENKDDYETKEKEIEEKTRREASESLRNNKSKEELKTMATELNQEKKGLEMEKNRQDRMGLTITEKMTQDCMDLLKLFGIPYIVAPMEAEAQCAFLEATELTSGTITDDSDIWLFGGRKVYKNFFDKQKHVLEFKIEQIQRDFSLDRDKLIQLAFLVGSDYTIGIKGIGAVTALEILAAFPSPPVVENETSKIMSILSSLRKFRDWFNNTKNGGSDQLKAKLKSKLKNIDLISGFPNLAIAEAYLYPNVDDSKEPFTWGNPDMEEIKKFTRKYFGWTQTKTEETLGPVLRRLEQKKSQTSIKNFFAVKSLPNKRDLKLSKRVEQAVKKISTNYNSEDNDEAEAKPIKKLKRNSKNVQAVLPKKNRLAANKTNTKKASARKRKTQNEPDQLVKPDGPSTLIKVFGESPEKKTKLQDKKPRIPQTKQVIPQREHDINEMNKRKEVASALFRRTRATEKKKAQ